MRYLLFILLLTGCQRYMSPEGSCNFFQTANLQRITWGLDTPITMYIDPSVPTSFIPTIMGAAEVWNSSALIYLGKPLFIILPYGPAYSDENTIYYLNPWRAYPSNDIGLTLDSYEGAQMVNSNILIDGQNFQYTLGNNTEWGYMNLESLMIHEFGHVLGLAHDYAPDTVMYPYLDYGQLRITLGKGNIASLECGY